MARDTPNMTFEGPVTIDSSDSFLVKSSLLASVLAFALLILLVVLICYLTLRLLRCSHFFCNRGQGSVGIQEVRVRHISVNPPSGEQQQMSGEEAIRCRTPPPHYSEVADCLPSYGTAVRDMDSAGARGGQQLNHPNSPDSVFFSNTRGDDSEDRVVPYLRLVPPTPTARSSHVSQ